jgi:hypothetical protein
VFLDVSNPLEIMMLALGLIWMLKKVAETEPYHELGVVLLTTVFSLVMLFSWMAFVNSFEEPWERNPEDHFTLSADYTLK